MLAITRQTTEIGVDGDTVQPLTLSHNVPHLQHPTLHLGQHTTPFLVCPAMYFTL